ncbi:MAG: TRAM domain-containing protein [Acidaminococcales bacterium]|nr:TRAM domain-containing protein [Acidaminococcales bacterium]
MLEKIWRIVIVVVFSFSGLLLGLYIMTFVSILVEPVVLDIGLFSVPLTSILSYLFGFAACGILGYFLAPLIIKYIYICSALVLNMLAELPTSEIAIGAAGLIIALIMANLLGSAASHLPFIGHYLPIVLSVVLGIAGVKLALAKKQDIIKIGKPLFREKSVKKPKIAATSPAVSSKILDTSVIIDGRIADICKTRFLEGTLLVPQFVLEELQRIADSADAMKRGRGRRGLGVLQEMRDDGYCAVEIVDYDYDDLTEVDSKLVRLGQELGASVVTNDYNLNKVAELQGVRVLNINELANSVKTAVLPGEEMTVNIIREGKEFNQGVAYLDDGTIIIVEGARQRIGEMMEVIVTSVLQTAAGKMVFAKLK